MGHLAQLSEQNQELAGGYSLVISLIRHMTKGKRKEVRFENGLVPLGHFDATDSSSEEQCKPCS